MIISDIRPQKKRTGRFNIFLDGNFAFSADAFFVTKHGLTAGVELTPDAVAKLSKDAEFAKIYNRVLALLARRQHSQREVEQYLMRREVGAVTIQMVIEKLLAQKFLDDREFARWLVSSRAKTRGPAFIKAELKEKGISPEIISEILAQTSDTHELINRAKELVARKQQRLHALPPKEKAQKIRDFLLRRGFSFDIVRTVVTSEVTIDEDP